MTSSKPKKEKIPDTGCNLWKEFSLNAGATCSSIDLAGLTFNVDYSGSATEGTLPDTHEEKILAMLTDIWHNQATMIKWLSKIAENTKPDKGKCTLES